MEGEGSALDVLTQEAAPPHAPAAPSVAGAPPSPTLPPSRGKGEYARASFSKRAASLAKRQRRQPTVDERRLWRALRTLKANWRRQQPIGMYVADFAHLPSKTIVEIDGYYHSLPERQAEDARRDAWLAANGYRVLRFTDGDVSRDIRQVVQTIAQAAGQDIHVA